MRLRRMTIRGWMTASAVVAIFLATPPWMRGLGACYYLWVVALLGWAVALETTL